MMHSSSSPFPVLLLSNVAGNIHEGCYLLLWAGLLWRSSHLRQYFKNKPPVCRYVQQKTATCSGGLLWRPSHLRQYLHNFFFLDMFNKNSNIPEQHCPF